jgi:hypothetical protein
MQTKFVTAPRKKYLHHLISLGAAVSFQHYFGPLERKRHSGGSSRVVSAALCTL